MRGQTSALLRRSLIESSSPTFMHEIPRDTPKLLAVRKAKCTVETRAVSAYGATFRPGLWCFVGPGSKGSWEFDQDTDAASRLHGVWDQNCSRRSVRIS